jgi:hypothetical protein
MIELLHPISTRTIHVPTTHLDSSQWTEKQRKKQSWLQIAGNQIQQKEDMRHEIK